MSSSPPPSSFSLFALRLTFTQGLVIGQLSIVLLLLLLLRFLLLADASHERDSVQARAVRLAAEAKGPWQDAKSKRRRKSGGAAAASGSAEGQALPAREIADRAGYDLGSHPAESADWVNVILALALAGYREDMQRGTDGKSSVEEGAREVVQRALNGAVDGKTAASFLDPIVVTSVDVGSAFPRLSDIRVRPADEQGRLRIEAELDYSDQIELSIETQLIINYPRPRFAVLPISLGLIIERFSGTLALELFSSPTTPPGHRSRHALRVSLHPDFALDARATSQLGSRAKLVDVPKLEQLLVERLRLAVQSKLVWPRFVSLSLPDLIPRAPAAVAAGTPTVSGSPATPTKRHETREQFLARHASARAAGALGASGGLFFEPPPPLASHPSSSSVTTGRAPSFREKQPQSAGAQEPPGALPAVEAWRNQAGAATGVEVRAGEARQRAR